MEPHTEFIGLKDLDEFEQSTVKDLAAEYLDKILRKLKSLDRVVYHLKVHQKGGKASKYSITLRAFTPEHVYETTAFDWNLPKATNMAYNEMLNEIEHRSKKKNEGKDLSKARKGWKLFKFFGR
jgi:hypothetical protein